MIKRTLIVISGISYDDYGLRDVSGSPMYSELRQAYDNIVEFRYQHLLDFATLPDPISRVYLDPLRLKLGVIRKTLITTNLKNLVKKSGGHVDIFAHSLGCWITAMTDIKVNDAYFFGSPIGFKTPVARFIVRNDIAFLPMSKPAFKVKNQFLNLWSERDLVGNKPVLCDDKKWGFGAKLSLDIETNTGHDFKEYLTYMYETLGDVK
jgi:hypothetical protein